jgi:predicted transcriptional regulator
MALAKEQQYVLCERFQVAFNQIHEELKKIVKIRDDRFKTLLNVGSRNHQMIKAFNDDLEQYAKLRNALVHDRREMNYYIAQPHVEIVEHIEKIASIFTRPNYALTIATKEVVFYNYFDHITDLINGIKEHSYSRYPVYLNNQYKGLLKTGDIVKWMSEHLDRTILDICNITVADVLALDAVKEHPVAFAPKTINIFDAEELFELAHQQNKNLEAVIITENGKTNESPLGLITAWDLIEIDYTAD